MHMKAPGESEFPLGFKWDRDVAFSVIGAPRIQFAPQEQHTSRYGSPPTVMFQQAGKQFVAGKPRLHPFVEQVGGRLCALKPFQAVDSIRPFQG